MLVTFKSDAAASIIMFGEVAKDILKLLKKDTTQKTGIFTLEQLPEAIADLRNAINRARAVPLPSQEDEPVLDGFDLPVSLAQRAHPLLELMERSLAARRPVTWE